MSENQQIPKYIHPEMTTDQRKMTREEVKQRFNQEVASLYSQRTPVWFPDFDFIFQLVTQVLEPFLQGNDAILDLGAGTGNLSRSILEVYDDILITLVDFSDNMLNEVPNVLSRFQWKYKTIKGDIFSIDFAENKYRSVVSSFALHHGRSEEEYGRVYHKIHKWLQAPGIFICCDVIDGDNQYLSRFNENAWGTYLKTQGFSDDAVNSILANYQIEDSPLSMRQHLRLLSEAGFQCCDFLWKKYNFGVYLGIKEDQS